MGGDGAGGAAQGTAGGGLPGGSGSASGGGGQPPARHDEDDESDDSDSDVDMTDVSKLVSNAPALPRAPQYKGRTMAERREFMRAYQTYCFALSAYDTELNRPYVMPVKNCVEARTLRRICFYELETSVEAVTEKMLVDYFLEARVPEHDDDYTSVDKDMKSLKMDVSLPDAVSRVEKLIDDMELILIRHNMDHVIRQREPKKLVMYLVAALAPPAFKLAVERKLAQEQYKSYKKDVVRFSKWIRDLLRGYIMWESAVGPVASTATKPKDQPKAAGSQSNHPGPGQHKGGQPKGRPQPKPGQQQKPPGTNPPGGKTPATPAASDGSGKPSTAPVFPCLKCNSMEHRVRDCPNATESEAKELVATWRAEKKEKTKKISKIRVPAATEGKKHSGDLLGDDDDGCVDATVDMVSVRAALIDSGADDTVVSGGVVRRLEAEGHFVLIAHVECTLLPFGDKTLSVSRQALFDEVILMTSAGPLRLRNLKSWIYDADDTLLLAIGRPVMIRLGYSTDGLLVKALQKKPVWDLGASSESLVLSEESESHKAQQEPKMVRIQQLRECVRLEDTDIAVPDEKEFRAATPKLQFDKVSASQEVHRLLEAAVQDAVGQGLPPSAAKELRRIVFKYEDVFRLEFGGDPPVKVPPLTVRLKPGAQPVKCKARRYPPLHREFLDRHVEELVKAGLLYENHRSRWASPALVVPKQDDLRMVVDNRRVNKCTEAMTWPMPNLEVALSELEGSEFYFVLDWFRGYWQLLLALVCREMYSIMTHKGIYTPTRVPMGATDSVAHCQGAVEKVFGDYLYRGVLGWLDDILGYASTIAGLLTLLEKVLERCAEFGLKLHPKKCHFFTRQVKWCGRMISGEGISHCPERVAGLVEMPVPKTAADLQQLLCAINWMRTSIPDYAKRTGVLYKLLDAAATAAQSRKKNQLAHIKLCDVGWDRVHEDAVAALKSALLEMVPLAHPQASAVVCLFTDASADYWGSVVTQIPSEDAGKPLEEQRHLPLAFLSGKFVGASSRWPTVEKEVFAIIESCKRLEYLLLRPGGFTIFTDHRILMYIFNPEVFDSGIARYQADRLQRWSIVLSLFPYVIEHIAGDENVWGDLLSRWGASDLASRAATLIRVTVIAISSEFPVSPLQASDFAWPSLTEVRELTKEVVTVEEGASEPTPPKTSVANLHWDGTAEIFRDDKKRVWIPPNATSFQTRVCIVAHAGTAGHRGAATTLQHLSEYFVWDNMEKSVQSLLKICLHCMRVDGSIVPRPFGEAIHATKPNEVLHFDFLSMPTSSDGLSYILVLKDDMSGFVELVPCASASSVEVFHALTDWFKRFGVVYQWVSDQGSHFKNTVIEQLRKQFGANHHFVTAYTPWANGSVEVVNRLVLHCIRALMSEQKLAIQQWPVVLPVVQMALNQMPADRLGGIAPVTAFTALTPQTPVAAILKQPEQKVVSVDWVVDKQKQHLSEVQDSLEKMHKKLAETSEKRRTQARKRHAARSGVVLPKFSVGDFVLVGQVFSRANKLAIQWKGPRRIVKTLNDYTFEVQNMVEPFDIHVVHASRMKLYAEAGLEMTEDLVDHIIHGEGGHLVEKFLECRYGRERKAWEIKVKWYGLDELEASWEPAQIMLEDQPDLVKKFIDESLTGEAVRKMATALGIAADADAVPLRRRRGTKP